ncbi:hypothetical protein DCAR_0623993 [Daucus carota subsp. sativus]|uniref:Uncharacterized protein n=1 Tax=Daucus carota subsp. sativus TaxID=79200 RepID=A0A164VKC1_DAUCS|nr:hypothetical protein DCAR_0623993 [Daucus carota subsp. sativus]
MIWYLVFHGDFSLAIELTNKEAPLCINTTSGLLLKVELAFLKDSTFASKPSIHCKTQNNCRVPNYEQVKIERLKNINS